MLSVSEERIQELIKHRRTIHAFPELKFNEVSTANYIQEHLTKLNFSFESKIAETGVVCLLDSGIPGKTILVRADMDALPIHEENQVEYKSQNPGVMHACGHDGHTSVLLGYASELKNSLQKLIPKGRVLLVFQPAEEGGMGADKMIEAGILEKYKVDSCLALHVWNHIDYGKIGVVDGPMMASVDEFKITITGKSGHAAMPEHTVDPIMVGSYLVTALQTLVSRNTDPLDSLVVTVGSFHSGDAFNAIPETAVLKGTIRTFSKQQYQSIPERFQTLVKLHVESFGAKAEIAYNRVDKPTINTPFMADFVRRAAVKLLGEASVTTENAKTMGGEDFSAFLEKVPGVYFFVGSRNAEKGFVFPHHNSKFNFDENAMTIGLAVIQEVVTQYLAHDGEWRS